MTDTIRAVGSALHNCVMRDRARTRDIAYDLPNREWSAKRGTQPMLNLYLYDIRENHQMRESDWAVPPSAAGSPNGARRTLPPKRIDLSFLVTAWAKELEDEHTLLWTALRVFLANPVLDRELLEGELRAAVDETDIDVRLTAGQPEGVLKQTTDFWTSIDNHLKPSINLVVTVPLVVDKPLEVGPPVETRIVHSHRISAPPRRRGSGRTVSRGSDSFNARSYRDQPGEVVTLPSPTPRPNQEGPTEPSDPQTSRGRKRGTK